MATQGVIYSDIDLQASTVSTTLVYDRDSVYNRIYTLLTTPKRSRMMLRTYGVDLLPLLFDPFTQVTADLIQFAILDAIKIWEPDLNVGHSDIEVVMDTENTIYVVTVTVRDPKLGVNPINMNFQLTRVGALE